MKKMDKNEMMSANGGAWYYCVCGFEITTKNGLLAEWIGACQYQYHLKRCVEALEAGLV